MLSNINPALPSPQRPELLPPLAPYDYGHHHRPLPSAAASAARRSADHTAEPKADVSPEHNIQKRIAPAPTPPRHKPELLHQHQPQHQPQRPHGFNSPRPALSPLSEYHSGFSDADYTPSHSHRRQQSLSNLLPLAFRSRTPSPTRNPPQLPEPMPYTGEGRSGPRGDTPKGGGLTGWFNNTAASSMLGMSSAQDDDHHTPNTTPTQLRRRPTTTSHPTTPKNNTAASRFMSALSSKFTGTTAPSTPASPLIDDEICTLNIEAALFPPTSTPTSPTSRDTFSPAAFKNLEMNAVGLLTKMQSAYRDRVATLKEIEAEKLAQREELEEAETRNRHLKMQLEGMARKAQDQEQEMARLVEELAKARADAERPRPFPPASSEGSVVCSEDLGVDEERRRRRAWARRSGETAKSSEAGGGSGGAETDDDESAESESVFSRCRSPTLTISGHMEGEGVPSQRGLLVPPPQTARAKVQQHQPPPPQPQLSAFQKIIKGIAGDAEETSGCSNCRGRDASVAWDTLSVLRDENKHLKVRMGELEVAVEGALDLVNGIGL